MGITAKGYVFCVTRLSVRRLLGSAEDTVAHNALKGLTSMEKIRVFQGKAGLWNQPQAATKDHREPHLCSQA